MYPPRELDRARAYVVDNFESQADIDRISIVPGFVEKKLNTNPEYIKSGKGSLHLQADNQGNAKANGNPGFYLKLDQPVDLKNYRGMGFWIYAPEGVVEHFFGRYDVKVKLNSRGADMKKELNLVPATFSYNWTPGHMRALSLGWTYYYWDFRDFTSLPMAYDFGFSFGEVMNNDSKIELYIDDIVLYPAAELDQNSNLNDPDWTIRYKVIKALEAEQTPEALEALIKAGGDGSKLIRETSQNALLPKAIALGAKANDTLRKLFKSDDYRVRGSVLHIVIGAQKEFAGLADDMIDQALTDDVYFLRHFAYEQLLKKGETPQSVTTLILKKMAEGKDKIACIRTLDMIGPQAEAAVPQLLAIVRDQNAPLMQRAWALKAMWWIDETKLTPADWIVGLELEPGAIHRHLLDIICRRLESAGEAAVPVLVEKLSSQDPIVRARAAALLGLIGSPELEKAAKDPKWYVAWEANKNSTSPAHVTKAADVSVKENGNTTTISNGHVELTFEKGNQCFGPSEIREPGGVNLIDGEWIYKYLAFKYTKSPAFRETQWLQKFFGAPFPKNESSKVIVNEDSVDFVYTYADNESPLVYEFHYVVKKGIKGFYGYIVTRNVSGKELPLKDGVGRLNYLLAVTRDHYDYAYLHDKFKGEAGPGGVPMASEEIMNATTRRADGQIWAKHEWDLYELESPVTGYCGRNGGFWLIMPDKDFCFDRYPRWQKIGLYDNIFVPHFDAKYNIYGLSSRVDEKFEKIYGPMLFYINNGENAEEMWVDAKRQAAVETAQWPYQWMKSERYHDRGTVKGKVEFQDGTNPESTYVILGKIAYDYMLDKQAQSQWMYSASPYNYYVRAKADGSFEIPNVHEAEYDLSIYKPGVLGADQMLKTFKVVKGETNDLGTLKVKPYDKGKAIWQIGIADGGAEEFRNGGNFHNWDNYDRYSMDFPNGVNYTVGKSDWSKDWNYVQPACIRGIWKPTTNTINFELKEIPKGEVVLMTAAGGRGPKIDVIMNDQKIAHWSINVGPHILRSAPYGGITGREVVVPKECLKVGNNVLQLSFGEKEIRNWTSQIQYDYIRLEER